MKISMPRMGALILSLGLLAAPYTASAQDAGNVIINSNPQGAVVKLIGEMTLSGITPVKFDRSLSGKYKIEVVREGFEKYRSVTYFTEKQASQLDIKLTPKTRAKAFVRSMIIPGWGQKYYGNSTKAGFYLLIFGTLSALIAWLTGLLFTADMSGSAGEVKETHEMFALITLGLLLATSVIRILVQLRKEPANGLKWLSFVLYALAAVSVSITGYFGGTLVYNYMMPL